MLYVGPIGRTVGRMKRAKRYTGRIGRIGRIFSQFEKSPAPSDAKTPNDQNWQ
jgi:hypothetical protein